MPLPPPKKTFSSDADAQDTLAQKYLARASADVLITKNACLVANELLAASVGLHISRETTKEQFLEFAELIWNKIEEGYYNDSP